MKWALLFILLLQTLLATSQQRPFMRMMFYNTENFFDTKHDTLKNDLDFTPQGKMKWTYDKYLTKLKNLAKVIIGVGEWEPPEIVGLCEIENRNVLNSLVKYTPLKAFDYGIIHRESPDVRGIDVAVLYRKDKFEVSSYNMFRIEEFKTRDIVYVKGCINKTDTVHVLVNHFPSRLGGELNSEYKRKIVAGYLRKIVDSIFVTNSKASIIIAGDFNDEPTNESLSETLRAKLSCENPNDTSLYNLSYYLQDVKKQGSLKYEGQWTLIDQFIVSGALLNKHNKIFTAPTKFIFTMHRFLWNRITNIWATCQNEHTTE